MNKKRFMVNALFLLLQVLVLVQAIAAQSLIAMTSCDIAIVLGCDHLSAGQIISEKDLRKIFIRNSIEFSVREISQPFILNSDNSALKFDFDYGSVIWNRKYSTIAQIEITQASISTCRGLHVGLSMAGVKAIYPSFAATNREGQLIASEDFIATDISIFLEEKFSGRIDFRQKDQMIISFTLSVEEFIP